MVKRISIYEYKRRVFNKCLLECMTRVHGMILNGDGMNGLNPFASDMENAEIEQTNKLAAKMCEKYMCDEMHLAESTIQTTRKRLSESITFMHDVMDVSEAIADAKAEDAKKNGVKMDDDQEIELNQEDQAVIDHLFDEKAPEMQIDQIRDATVNALLAEDRKAQEIRDSMNIANAQVSSGDNADALKESMDRINKIGPTSLMNAIINSVTASAIKQVNESSGITSVSEVMRENADLIKTRAVIIYSLYETCNVFGITKYTPAEVKRIAEKIYYNK